jgi:predicted small lipoprotein YifL
MRYALVVLTVLLAACGQKGPLTLPDKQPGPVVTRPAQAPADAPPAEDPQKKKDEAGQQP